MGRRLAFGPICDAGPAYLRAGSLARSLAHPRRARPATEHARRVAAMRRRSSPRVAAGLPCPPRTRQHLPSSICLPSSISFSLSLAQQQQSQRMPAFATAHRTSPKLARPAVPARRRPLHLARSSASTSRSLCSSPFDVVRLEPAAIAHRSAAELTGELCSHGHPLSAPPFSFLSRA